MTPILPFDHHQRHTLPVNLDGYVTNLEYLQGYLIQLIERAEKATEELEYWANEKSRQRR